MYISPTPLLSNLALLPCSSVSACRVWSWSFFPWALHGLSCSVLTEIPQPQGSCSAGLGRDEFLGQLWKGGIGFPGILHLLLTLWALSCAPLMFAHLSDPRVPPLQLLEGCSSLDMQDVQPGLLLQMSREINPWSGIYLCDYCLPSLARRARLHSSILCDRGE